MSSNIEVFSELEIVEDADPVDLEDLILFGLGETVYRAMKLFGKNQVIIRTPENKKITIEVPEGNPLEKIHDRLHIIVDSLKDISEKAGVSYKYIIGLVLILDGWRWDKKYFRTPIWMNDHVEITTEEARKIEGLSWLIDTSSEISSRQREEKEEFGE